MFHAAHFFGFLFKSFLAILNPPGQGRIGCAAANRQTHHCLLFSLPVGAACRSTTGLEAALA